MTKKEINHDYIVIGAGSGGLVVAVGLHKMGKDIVVVSENVGGDCTNYGCVPSKTFLALSNKYQSEHSDSAKKDLKDNVFNKINIMVESFIEEEEELLPKERFYKGRAEFKSKNTIKYKNDDDIIDIKFNKKCIIATGSSPRKLVIEGLDNERILSNEGIFSLEKIPESITIIGAGPIGIEMATAFSNFGSKVYLVSNEILAREPKEISNRVLKFLQDNGVEYFSSKVEKFKNGILKLENGDEIPDSDIYLAAIGRVPNTDLNLDVAGIEYRSSGIVTNRNLITNNTNVFAIGDVGQNPQFTHLAANQAKFVLKKISFPLARKKDRALPRVTFTDPPIASVGELSESDKVKKFILDFSKTDKSRTNYNSKSYGEVYIDISSGLVKGASLYGDFSEDLINLFTLMIDENVKITQMTEFITPYPTYGNVIDRLIVEYFGYLSKNWKNYPLGSARQIVSYSTS